MNQPTHERFSRLQFPVHKITAKSPLELFEILPGLRRYFQRLSDDEVEVENRKGDGSVIKALVNGHAANYKGLYTDDLVKIIKYIVFVFDPDSDLVQEYPDDYRLRKEAAAKEAGFKRGKDGEFPPYIRKIIDFKEKQVVDWILDYMKVKRNSIFKEINFVEQELEVLYHSRSVALQEGRVEPTLLAQIKVRLDEKDTLYQRFYAEHTELRKSTQEEIYPVSPENVFKALQIPADFSKIRQVRDVSQNNGVEQIHN